MDQIAQSTGLSIDGKRLMRSRRCAAAAPVMMTWIGVIKALNLNVEGTFNPDAKKNYREQAQAKRRSVSHGVKLGTIGNRRSRLLASQRGPASGKAGLLGVNQWWLAASALATSLRPHPHLPSTQRGF